MHWSDACQVTPFNLAIGYQQMKQVLCYQRQMEFEKNDYDITKMPEESFCVNAFPLRRYPHLHFLPAVPYIFSKPDR